MNKLSILMEVLLSNDIKANEQILFDIIPELKNEKDFAQNSVWHDKDVWNHTIATIEACNMDFLDRLTLLLHDIGKPFSYQDDENGIRHFVNHANVSSKMAKPILKHLEIDNNAIDEIIWLIDNHASKVNIKDIIDEDIDKYLHLLKIQICDAKGYEHNHSLDMIVELVLKDEELRDRKKNIAHGR